MDGISSLGLNIPTEAFFIGNTDPLAQFYSKSTGEEEDTTEEEPAIEPEKIEKVTVPTGGMSDDDYEAFLLSFLILLFLFLSSYLLYFYIDSHFLLVAIYELG
jgi:hypothetical protein